MWTKLIAYTSTPVTARPYTIRLDRPHRSANPANRAEKTPSPAPTMATVIRNVSDMFSSLLILVATDPPTYSS